MKYIERLLLISAAFLLAGTNKCREDYFFASQSKVSITGTPNQTGTATPSGTVSATPTEDPDATETPDPDLTATATPSPTRTATATATATTAKSSLIEDNVDTRSAKDLGSPSLLGELAKLDDPRSSPLPTARQLPESSLDNPANIDGTWLGNLYRDEDLDEDAAASWSTDLDRDGFVDALEEALGSDKNNSQSQPGGIPKTSLESRVRKLDQDVDGLSDKLEAELGTVGKNRDSDGDGVWDGAEYLSGSNPLDAQSKPLDSDGHGLSDDYEVAMGLNPNLADTDGDGLNDFMELVYGSNPLARDSDMDGIMDGKEVSLGGDPMISDFPKN